MMLYVISYDIPDDERRLKVAKILGHSPKFRR